MSAQLEPWQKAWLGSRRDPYLFVTEVLGVPPHDPSGETPDCLEAWHEKALKAMRDGKKRLSIRSGHGVGKTCFLAWMVLWAMLCFGPDTKVPIAAGSKDQLRDTIQPEISKWHRRLPEPLAAQLKIDVERVSIRAAPDQCFAVFRTASKDNPQALAGFHASNLLFLIDEASAVAEIAFEVALGALSTPDAMVVMTGNPTKSSGFFYDSHHKTRDRWYPMQVSSEDVPRARGHIEDVIANYGKASNRYRVRVLGEFPTQDDETIISLTHVMASVGRKVAKSNVWPVWGVDPGRFGDDPSALVARQGNTLLSGLTREWHGLDGPQLAGRIIAMYNALPIDDRPREIAIDVIGIGASCYDHLRLAGSPCRTITTGVNVAEATAVSETEHRLRDELWFRGRAWFAQLDCCVEPLLHAPDTWKLIEKMFGELTVVTYDYNVLGKRLAESKKDLKKRQVPSPNLADAFLNTLACGIYPRSNPHQPYRPVSSGSAWTA